MFRSVLAVVLGYVAIVVTTVVCVVLLTLAFNLPFDPTVTTVTPPTAYVMLNLLSGVVCAMVGGAVTARVAPAFALRNVRVLAGIVLVLGVVFALTNLNGPHPAWYLILTPIIGAVGVLLGGLLAGPRPRPVSAE